MTTKVRELHESEREVWVDLRAKLWPDTPRADLAAECVHIVTTPEETAVLVAADERERLAGFVEVSLRAWAEGCETKPAGYLEAWYVEPEHRRTGLGRRLVDAAMEWSRARGCVEFASDVELENDVSHRAHRALGFEEVVRVVLYRRSMPARSGGGTQRDP